ncbi:SGNH/GDSL hydrolase family protein [Fredinandcohnia onubensis]|uniref:SGNH/GDSL hydrolase family protein n=1 Tax=Fredinandcohnia onubensis TaxID=1571209 RepID=UPI000C0C08A2|nr:SGNH/GDSL hydrolase family protein [Fredinandcohnia onubensis]
MKKLIVIVVVILSFSAIVVGKMHWNNKIEANAKIAQSEKPDVLVKTVTEGNQDDVKKVIEVKNYSKNLPQDIQTKLISAAQNGTSVNLIIAGSNSTPKDPIGWPTLLKQELEKTYGEDVLNVKIKEIADKTSTQVVQEELYREIIELSPDILLFEPFILYDNGHVVPIERRLNNITEILGTITEELPDVSILLQPANPLYNARNYPNEIDRLEGFAEDNNYTYLNHWKAWPAYKSKEIIEYLNDGEPSEKGHEVWAQYLLKYFTANNN